MLLCAPTIVEKVKPPQLVKTCHLIQLLSAYQAAVLMTTTCLSTSQKIPSPNACNPAHLCDHTLVFSTLQRTYCNCGTSSCTNLASQELSLHSVGHVLRFVQFKPLVLPIVLSTQSLLLLCCLARLSQTGLQDLQKQCTELRLQGLQARQASHIPTPRKQ